MTMSKRQYRVLFCLLSLVLLFAAGCSVWDHRVQAPVVSAIPSPSPSSKGVEPGGGLGAAPGPIPSLTPLVPYKGPVEHLFFHPLVVDPALAFDGDPLAQGYDDYFVTVSEFQAILEELYKRDYVLVDPHLLYRADVRDGKAVVTRLEPMLPEGKKPLILSVDDINYYDYMRSNGNAWRLVPDSDGSVTAELRSPDGRNARTSRTGDVVPILDDFVKLHPDFSFQGAKGVLNLTGYEGVLGYRTNDRESPDYESEKAGAEEVIRLLKQSGWTFASHSWGHIDAGKSSLERLKKDTARWKEEVEPLVGPTDIYVFPFGSSAKPGDPKIAYLKSQGFRLFCGVGPEPYLVVRDGGLFMDRRHMDGIALRTQRDRLEPLLGDRNILDPARNGRADG